MKFGFLTECYVRKGKSQTLAFRDMFAQADAAEELGMDAVWVVEHHFRPDSSVLSAPMAVLGAIASRTKRIRVGTAVRCCPWETRCAWLKKQRALPQGHGVVLRTRVVYGSPESVVERLEEFKSRMGATGFLLDMNFSGQIPQERVLNSMRLLMEQVAPRFK